MSRRAASVDANQPEIIAAFRKLGCTVKPLHTVGQGYPDLLVGYRHRTHVVEIKDGSKSPSKRKLTHDQQAWRESWRGDYFIVESLHDVESLVKQWCLDE